MLEGFQVKFFLMSLIIELKKFSFQWYKSWTSSLAICAYRAIWKTLFYFCSFFLDEIDFLNFSFQVWVMSPIFTQMIHLWNTNNSFKTKFFSLSIFLLWFFEVRNSVKFCKPHYFDLSYILFHTLYQKKAQLQF